MNLKTEIKLPKYPFNLHHEDKIISFGSCFSENIGQKLKENKFDININPFGILFNPISVAKAMEDCLINRNYKEEDLDQNGEIHFSFNHHSRFAGLDKKKVLDTINTSISEANKTLKEAKVLIITLGSAWVYRKKDTRDVVANCYKIPQTNFVKELLTVDEVVTSLERITDAIKIVNPKIEIITTISPVRHWKDGVVENQQSKGTLHLALKYLNDRVNGCNYFPSFEIMMDELRDYRFYAEDMLHPSDLAIEYIWEKFGTSFFTKETQELNKRIAQIQREKNHKPFNPESEDSIAFAKKTAVKETQLYTEFPFLK